MIVTIDNLGAIGVVRDAYAHEIAPNAWSGAANVRFREGFVEKMRGHTDPFGAPSVIPYHLQPLTVGANRYWIYGGLAKLYYVDNAGTHTNITRQTASVDVDYSATADKRWNGGVLAGVAILNNAVDAPQQWAGTGKATALSNWPASTTCRVIRPHLNHLIALNVTESGTNYPHMVRTSQPADPGAVPSSWDYTDATLDCKRFDISDDAGHILDGLSLGDQFIVYTENAYHRMNYVGVPDVWSRQKVAGSQGIAVTNGVCEFPGGHFVLGHGDIFWHAGGAPQSVFNGRLRKWIFNQLDESNYVRSFVCANPLQNECWVCFVPSGASGATYAAVWNYRDDTTAIRELPTLTHAAPGVVDSTAANNWDSDSETWDSDDTAWDQADITKSAPRLMMAGAGTKLYLADQSKLFDDSAITAYVQREGLTFGDPKRVKLLKRIVPQFEANAGTAIRVRVGSTMDPATGYAWDDYRTFTAGTDIEIHCEKVGRYLAVEFNSNSATAAWRLKQYAVELNPLGRY